MKFKGAGRILMAAGVVGIIFYILAALYGESGTAIAIGRVLFYFGIAAIVIGLALRLSRISTRDDSHPRE